MYGRERENLTHTNSWSLRMEFGRVIVLFLILIVPFLVLINQGTLVWAGKLKHPYFSRARDTNN